ncbi:MAG: nucleoside phosphorylase [Clostridia bacterium]|nr:nucleoside phosphorylase [Clostridia bacterium]
MSILESFVKNSKPMITVEDVYQKSDVVFKSFIVTFSFRTVEALMEDGLIETVAEDAIRSISCHYPVYRFIGTDIGLIKTTVGAPLTSVLIEEMSYMFSCRKAVIFGSCGSLDKSIPEHKLIVPTDAYRDEGTSYHYMEPSDYIRMKNHKKVCEILDELPVGYVTGKTWTTDAFYRETAEEIKKRKSEGCIAVEMEFSACQAVCDYAGIELYGFLYRADNLDSAAWEKSGRDALLSKDKRLDILNVAFEIAKRI